ncbi:MAG TPA: glycogen synthase GlgA [bacterium]|nr:glycogen synthase GlgA [bacterium]HQG45046.1 glycogen synthase GlgA [bacterium]HQI47256.1 glycogen synthase GlgA [bacterium]HQJ64235.1 glycogen synthase GlgA [bacterium]
MKNRLRILYLSTEVAPFAKTGGLADVASALPKALFEQGHDVRVMMPKYGNISERRYTLREVIRLKDIPIRVGAREHVVSAKSAFLPDTKVQVYFLDYRPFFERADYYVDSATGKDFPDNAQRFFLFSKAVIETIKLLHWEPQIIHCNDWQTALVPWMLRNSYQDDPFFAKAITVLSIHNLAFQGTFPPAVLDELGLPKELAVVGSDLEFYGKINFLKAGIKNADLVTTVSPTYAQEIQSDPELGCGLQGVLSERREDLFGILNGVDYAIWNPEKDNLIPATYSTSSIKDKEKNKKALAKEAGLPYAAEMPIVGMISRLTNQKGLDLVAAAIDDLVKLPVQLVILGTGDPQYHKLLEKIRKGHSQQVAVFLRFDDQLAHLIEAGSDMFLMPSLYEPCGLNQMYSLKYGTIPIVRRTGGLADTIFDAGADPANGNGFVFNDYTSKALVDAVRRAVAAFHDDKGWQKLIKRCMKQDFSWAIAAEKYIKLYLRLETAKKKR